MTRRSVADSWSDLSDAEVIDRIADLPGSEPVGRWVGSAEMTRRLATSLNLYREEANAQAARITFLTWVLVVLTPAILGLTGVLVWLELR